LNCNLRKKKISPELLIEPLLIREVYRERWDGKKKFSAFIFDIEAVFDVIDKNPKVFAGKGKSIYLGNAVISLQGMNPKRFFAFTTI
jgi:hypothetical protein